MSFNIKSQPVILGCFSPSTYIISTFYVSSAFAVAIIDYNLARDTVILKITHAFCRRESEIVLSSNNPRSISDHANQACNHSGKVLSPNLLFKQQPVAPFCEHQDGRPRELLGKGQQSPLSRQKVEE
ncbi:hypothetical protein E3P84_04201 [Wallemia ichthyophaga]|nr:hypothetical protein E3P96_04181 [Wallemia ichthyophaga]TIA94527.1 hypothetical protein E3P95_04188 [Wallemia ichthyophaga]TIA94620.1 hypothetical protein E3P94_04190 [Wallemia ichthyophaga]TIB27584.1 hypothetical protein E3P84_04201 [Wallemia ichthyophaga]